MVALVISQFIHTLQYKQGTLEFVPLTHRMPEQQEQESKNDDELLVLQNNLIQLKQKLLLEQKMFDAAKLIRVRMDKQANVQQVENSLTESKGRISFLEEQVKEMDKKIFNFHLTLKRDISSNYSDAIIDTCTSKWENQRRKRRTNFNFLLAEQKLTWSKIEHKIGELSYRLKLDENILEAEEKLIEAFKKHDNNNNNNNNNNISNNNISNNNNCPIIINNNNLVEGKEATKQRIQILNQALKKYTSLVTHNESVPATPSEYSHVDEETTFNFTGKLLIKLSKIVGLSGAPVPPFIFNFYLDQMANFRSGAQKSSIIKTTKVVISTASKDPDNLSAYTCYQEIVLSLSQAKELEFSIGSGTSAPSIKGIFFVKLATLFASSGPDEEGIVSNIFEIEPTGSVHLQFRYSNQF